jgi:ribosomal protein S18 acetylase RimI-like enzyme
MDHEVRTATAADAAAIGQLMHDFNSEFGDPTPGPERIADRIRELLEGGETTVFVVGPGPDGLALVRFRLAVTSPGLEGYLAELYVKPGLRGGGRGRALMEQVLAHARERGADWIGLETGADDRAARALYESFGLKNTDLYYELELR